MVEVYDTDTAEEAAAKIFYGFEVGQSCAVTGLEIVDRKSVAKGEKVLEEIRRLDTKENVQRQGTKNVRRRKFLPNSIGGYVAHKIFRWKYVISDKDVKYTIWRMQ